MSLRRDDYSSRTILPPVVCLSVISKPQQRKDLGPLRLSSNERKHSHGAKSGDTAGSKGQLIIRPTTILRKAVMELLAVWSVAQSDWKKR